MCQISGGMEKKHKNCDFYKGNGVLIWDLYIKRSSINLISVDFLHPYLSKPKQQPQQQNINKCAQQKLPEEKIMMFSVKNGKHCTSEVLAAVVLLQERLEVSLNTDSDFRVLILVVISF